VYYLKILSDAPIANLILQDGTVYQGEGFGSLENGYGEVVFTTGMTGYQEMLTDPSFAGQIITITYPIVGNYGISDTNIESEKIQASGLIIRNLCDYPSHSSSAMTLDNYLKKEGVPGIHGIDTRSLAKKLRSSGVMMGAIAFENQTEKIIENLKIATHYENLNLVEKVSTKTTYSSISDSHYPNNSPTKIAILDYGVKFNIQRILKSLGCDIITLPHTSTAQDILELKTDGLLLSPGPGDPKLLNNTIEMVKTLSTKLPIFGICLGHQIIARAFGANTYKLKFGHRGANHPVINTKTGKVSVTSQNHGYAVDKNSLPNELTPSYINLNDDTVEGLVHNDLPIMTLQFHSEASPGPTDNKDIFENFLNLIKKGTV
tara:strand:- start:13861 stop:14985 length:1125 start_codon:yes stop_codon:yes gene_type:complete